MDDLSRTPPLHLHKGELRELETGREIRRQREIPFLDVDHGRGFGAHVSVRGDEHVEPAERVDRLADRSGDLLAFSEVGDNDRLEAEIRRRPLGHRSRATDACDDGAFRAKAAHDARADAAPGARDDRPLAGEQRWSRTEVVVGERAHRPEKYSRSASVTQLGAAPGRDASRQSGGCCGLEDYQV
ncbi:MAG: hypothetical protein M0Z95_19125 [Actinomycetota bacterium]|nr:hypothetical protein [Actinomycetota bacterium]